MISFGQSLSTTTSMSTEICVCEMRVRREWRGSADTFSMMTSFAGINGVAQQPCAETLIWLAATLIPLAFPLLKYGGSVSYQACYNPTQLAIIAKAVILQLNNNF